jgi:transcription elongation factor Elf1
MDKHNCPHEGEQVEVSTYGDLGRSVQRLVCLGCGQVHEVPYDWSARFGMAANQGARP